MRQSWNFLLELKIQEFSLQLEQIYNMEESGLFSRMLPDKIFLNSSEKSAHGKKMWKDQLAFISTNSISTHKLPLQIVGKAKFQGIEECNFQ